MPARRSEYNQLGIGDCGHVVVTWPQVTSLEGHHPRVICEDCTREQYGIADAEPLIWVRLKAKSILPKPPPRKRAPRKPKPKTLWQQFMEQEGLF